MKKSALPNKRTQKQMLPKLRVWFAKNKIKIVFLLVAATVFFSSLGSFVSSDSNQVPSRPLTKVPVATTPQIQPFTSLSDYSSIINKEKGSVVKVQGYGCGGEVFGSGFVVAPHLVATNAHVIAGIASPEVVDNNGIHDATPILFDPTLDFAVLRVNNLDDAPLTLDQSSADTVNWSGSRDGEHDILLGYPGGGDFQALLATITDEYVAEVSNVFGVNYTERDLYKIAADVEHGNSGGPLIQQNGQVAGIVFAMPPDESDTGLVLTTADFYSEVQQAKTLSASVGTQSCADLNVK